MEIQMWQYTIWARPTAPLIFLIRVLTNYSEAIYAPSPGRLDGESRTTGLIHSGNEILDTCKYYPEVSQDTNHVLEWQAVLRQLEAILSIHKLVRVGHHLDVLREVAKLYFLPLDPRVPDVATDVLQNLSPHVQACVPGVLNVAPLFGQWDRFRWITSYLENQDWKFSCEKFEQELASRFATVSPLAMDLVQVDEEAASFPMACRDFLGIGRLVQRVRTAGWSCGGILDGESRTTGLIHSGNEILDTCKYYPEVSQDRNHVLERQAVLRQLEAILSIHKLVRVGHHLDTLREVAKLYFLPLDPRVPDVATDVFQNLSPHVQACVPSVLNVAPLFGQ
ncbi:hypothetical protein F0562_034351 [Nyssa sinensis]|uniref:Nuclear pore protein n=1 Tax=Nyssa sinensis TaxID=561372 RepID=A0A5J5AIW0_9ASTE|nr:hypothetical protein F0562_034351 [Nyssa sinensis]